MKKTLKPDVRVHIFVSGIVQGVFFRANTKSEADLLEIHGWVRNNSDGTVEIMAEGQKGNIEQFIQWCHEGPPGAVVKNVRLTWEKNQGDFKSFDVVYYY